jgi:methylmalonyl-CoA mutase
LATLFKQFSPVSKTAWLEKIKQDLKGKPIEALNWQATDSLSVSPFAHADDLSANYPPLKKNTPTNAWEIGVKIQVGNLQLANQEALSALKNGANAIAFECSKSPSKTSLNILLKNIELEWISIHFIFKHRSWKRFLQSYVAFIKEQNYDKEKLNCSFSFKGELEGNPKEFELLTEIATELPKAQLFTIKSPSFSNKTVQVEEELAQLMLKGSILLNQLADNNLDLHTFSKKIQFSLDIGDSYFLNIAKIRALKICWQQILKAWELEATHPANIEIHLGTNTQTDNEDYNKIKATAQAMAAVISGVQRLYIYPSDEFKDGIGSPFAQRIALNIQHLLQMESYMDRVVDPSAGSYYIENLTTRIAEQAWKQFQDLI